MPIAIFYSMFIGKISVTTGLPLTGPDMNKPTLPGHQTLIKIKFAVIVAAVNKPEEFGPAELGSMI
jgi:hypothetical protein